MSHAHRPWGYQPPNEGHAPDLELHPQTQAIRAGTERSGFGETSEALYLTSGFTYDNAEQAEHAFIDEVDHYVYSRFANPTVAMFEKRLAAIEGVDTVTDTETAATEIFAGALLSLSQRAI